MKRLEWQARDMLRRVGLPGWLALAALTALAGWWGLVYEPTLQRSAQLSDEVGDLQKRLRRDGAPRELPATPAQQMASFQSQLPNDQGITASLAKLNAAARRQSLALDQAEFRWAAETGDAIGRYGITLPVKGEYRQLRRFIQDALRELPSLALEEVSVRRTDTKSPQLDVRLRFVLFVRTGA